jgi:hypothetical protein
MSNSSKQTVKNREEVYVDLQGRKWSLALLDADERALLAELQRRAEDADWFEFDNYWLSAVVALYEPRGMSRRQLIDTPLFRIAQDLSGRIAIRKGYARIGDYRDELQLLIATRFKNRREFCEATGISEDMLSHVLAGRKDLSLGTLGKALDKIGWTLHLAPAHQAAGESS